MFRTQIVPNVSHHHESTAAIDSGFSVLEVPNDEVYQTLTLVTIARFLKILPEAHNSAAFGAVLCRRLPDDTPMLLPLLGLALLIFCPHFVGFIADFIKTCSSPPASLDSTDPPRSFPVATCRCRLLSCHRLRLPPPGPR